MSESPFNQKLNPFTTSKQKNNSDAHAGADTDIDRSAIHHTLGSAPNQAAPGNHSHKAGDVLTWVPNTRNNNGTALAHTLRYANYRVVGGVCHWYLGVVINVGGPDFVRITLPLPVVNYTAYDVYVGSGRETQTTGKSVEVWATDATTALLGYYDNTGTAILGRFYICSGSFLVAG